MISSRVTRLNSRPSKMECQFHSLRTTNRAQRPESLLILQMCRDVLECFGSSLQGRRGDVLHDPATRATEMIRVGRFQLGESLRGEAGDIAAAVVAAGLPRYEGPRLQAVDETSDAAR